MKKKILVISQFFWPEKFIINNIVSKLHLDGFNVDVLTGYPNYPEGKIFKNYRKKIFKEKHADGYNIYRVSIIPRGQNSYFLIALNYLSFLLNGILFVLINLRKKKYDTVFVFCTSPIFQAYIGIFIKFINKSKLVLWIQDLWPFILIDMNVIKNNFFINILNLFVKKIYNSADVILAQSQSFQKIINKSIKKKNKKKIIYIPNPAPDVKLKKNKNIKNKKFRILYAGNLGYAQSTETILKLIMQIQKEDIFIDIAGEGSRFNYLKENIIKHKLQNVKIHGYLDKKRIKILYTNCDALLVTLKKGKFLNMTIPSKIQTYLSTKKPIIGSLDGEGSKLIKNSNSGFVSPSENVKSLKNNIIKLKNLKKSDRIRLGVNGHKYFMNNFKFDRIYRKITKTLY